MTKTPLWTPSPEFVANTNMARFHRFAAERAGRDFADTPALHQWSIADPGSFWDAVWDFCDVIGDKGGRQSIDGDKMPGARFFPDAELNVAENLMRQRGLGDALVFRGEDKAEDRLSHDELHQLVSRLQQALVKAGIGPGDRVAAILPNIPFAMAAFLAANSIGAVWSSASPDFGAKGIEDRFGQIEPKLIFAVNGYWYNGKWIDLLAKIADVAARLEGTKTIVVVDYPGSEAAMPEVERAVGLADFVSGFTPSEVGFTRMPFDHPLYILYSSGTTGVPKCIVHRAGGALIQQLKEHVLHADVRTGDKVFYFTTLGWMMWNWLLAGLGAGATLLLYDGSPFAPSPEVLFDYAEAEGMTLFGTSAKFIDSLHKADVVPAKSHDLSTLRTICSTGSPLSNDGFEYVYSAIKPEVHLASISGGTDIVSCFVLGDPTRPVWRGEIQGPGLGMAVAVWDEAGQPVTEEKGELVCTRPFPSMPLKFWNDPDGAKYHAAYFERFVNIWCHGDYAEVTGHGGIIIHGRSDATLNPGGVRIGTAEIYAQVEKLPEVVESICVGQDFDGDVRVVLFVRLSAGAVLDESLEKRIKQQVRQGASPRHVPAKIVAVADIPRTKSGKITELAVRDVIHGRTVKNVEALANPEALALYRDLPALRG